ncbi:geranylgeranylglyceryl/heptaprenylglyceryl phosphate synthase [Halegenticoccus soli]|uniref:geranylgeranylglyceryl/heptaprenylglyceryl phosphate synthase n=1 Tax=Halegenticoccus soli TaxID=1985678 RepID=UPI000C6DA449|nr:geranylgeranylglyceryl/heptaprenylglyceryl phosphate synthase [Halegenticoccus soli]
MLTRWTNWTHVTKVDPDKSLPDGNIYAAIADTGTDTLIIGGTTTVTEHHVRSLLGDLSQ